jgi:hypothetical protein
MCTADLKSLELLETEAREEFYFSRILTLEAERNHLAKELDQARVQIRNLTIQRDDVVKSWINVWHLLEAEPSYIAREQEAKVADQVWQLQHS